MLARARPTGPISWARSLEIYARARVLKRVWPQGRPYRCCTLCPADLAALLAFMSVCYTPMDQFLSFGTRLPGRDLTRPELEVVLPLDIAQPSPPHKGGQAPPLAAEEGALMPCLGTR